MTTIVERKPNVKLIKKIVVHIEEDPMTRWAQKQWITFNCNTRFCFAGWAVALSGLVNKKTGKPTKKGLDFIEKHELPRAFQREVYPDNGPSRLVWDFPYAEAGEILLGLDKGYTIHPLFSQWAAKPKGFRESNYNYIEDHYPADDIEVFKGKITEHTGVTFEPVA